MWVWASSTEASVNDGYIEKALFLLYFFWKEHLSVSLFFFYFSQDISLKKNHTDEPLIPYALLLTYVSTQQIFIKHSQCAWHFSRLRGINKEKRDKVLALGELMFQWGRQKISKHINICNCYVVRARSRRSYHKITPFFPVCNLFKPSVKWVLTLCGWNIGPIPVLLQLSSLQP